MPKSQARLPDGTRVSDKVTFGHFASVYSKVEIRSALRRTNKESKRERELPNHLVVYFVMMMAIFRDSAQQEVLRLVSECVQWLFGPKAMKVMAKSSISEARSRVGFEPFREVFHTVAKPLAASNSGYAFFKGLRIVALDGSLFDVPDTAENQVFGRATGPHGPGAFPQARLVSFVECGTHAMFAAEVGGYKDSEQALARRLFSRLPADSICLADRNFLGTDIFREAANGGAKLLWRATKTFKLTPEQYLSDGSYLTTLYAGTDRMRENPVPVRVVEYVIEGVRSEPIRLVTNWLNPNEATAEELAVLYSQRWEYEIAMDELKVDLNANEIVLRSQKEELVKQEIYGLVMAHYAIRKIMYEAACEGGLDDDVLSFSHAVRVIRRRLPMFGNFPPGADTQGNPSRDLTGSCVFESRTV